MQVLCDSIKKPNLGIMGNEEEVQNNSRKFPNLEKEKPIQVQETSRTPYRQDQNRLSP
jgi:hypothetical protein